MLSQVVTNQAGKQRGARQEVTNTLRIREFLRMNPPSFTGSRTTEDPECFVEELKMQKQKGLAPSSTSAPAPRNKGEYNGKNSQNFRARLTQSQGSVAQGGNWAPACSRYGRTHPSKCHDGQSDCFKCGQEGHFMNECPKNRAQSSSVAPPDMAAPRGATSGIGGGANHLYAITSRHKKENSPDVVTVAFMSHLVAHVESNLFGELLPPHHGHHEGSLTSSRTVWVLVGGEASFSLFCEPPRATSRLVVPFTARLGPLKVAQDKLFGS
uniref:Gag-pol polyprotein n=1 Tax=Solanum tuberosum TaxID=4113 RepID=M1DTX1_SOLTU